MDCPQCKSTTRIAKTTITSEVGSTDVYANQIMVCVNPECDKYEKNINDPSNVIEVIRNKMN